MTDLMRKHIGFGKLSRHSEALLQFIVEAQINVYLLVTGTVKRSAGGLRHATSGIDAVAEQHQLGVPVAHALGAEDLGPSLLRVVKHEREKTHPPPLLFCAGCVPVA